ncbi:hypothetical protein [Flavobacterium sp. 22076]|jgi:hypothetical protein|uniref:hypothetical protein n=1 Tax=unclassified Flavobacterium TaxID=196869 RepID=UPI003F84FEA9
MKFFYILNNKNEAVEFGKITSERYAILKKISSVFDDQKVHQLIDFSVYQIEKLLEELLKERNFRHSEGSENNKFHQEINLFITKTYKEKELLLCQTGFDNKIIFLINIVNALLKNEGPYYLLFTENHRDFREWQN